MDTTHSAAAMNLRSRRHWPWLVITAGALAARRELLRRSRAGLHWYQAVYWLLYRVGVIIWQRPAPPAELVSLVEGPSPLPVGRALDLGCGTGTDTVYLATHGWQVTAVDMVPKALAEARRRATAAGVAVRFVHGDVTRLTEFGVGDGYTLLMDFGCFHTLPDDQRSAYVSGVSHAAAPRCHAADVWIPAAAQGRPDARRRHSRRGAAPVRPCRLAAGLRRARVGRYDCATPR